MSAQVFRSFYLVFCGLFALLLFGIVGVCVVAVQRGDTASVATGSVLAALSAMLSLRSACYMRE